MGLLEQRAKAKQQGKPSSSGALARRAQTKQLSPLARKAAENGNAPKLSPLAAKLAGKKRNPLAEARARRDLAEKKSSKLDFHVGGILFHNCQNYGNYWTIDVSNGDESVTFHNRFSAWFSGQPGGIMKEPPRDIHFALQKRYNDELIARKIPTREQQLAQKIEEERKRRPRKKKNEEEE